MICITVIHTCASTRDVVLDFLMHLPKHLNSLSKFVSRRGFPQIILSDNGSSFIAGITQNFVASKNSQLDFNFANVPWSLILMASLPY